MDHLRIYFQEVFFMNIKSLSDKVLLNQTHKLVEKEQNHTLQIIKHLEEIYLRRLFSDLGYNSLFSYCTEHLNYSPAQAQRRINAARLIKDIPQAEKMIEQGTLSLSNASSVQTHINQENKNRDKNMGHMEHNEKLKLLEIVKDKSARQTDRILAEQSTTQKASDSKETKRAIKGGRVQLKFSLKENDYQELVELQEQLGMDNLEGLILKLKDLAKTKQKKMKTIKTTTSKKLTNRYIPAHVKRAAFQRTKGKCQICGTHRKLEYDHKQAHALGGTSDVNNIRLLCKSCNQRQAIIQLGQVKMDQYINT